MTFEQLYSSSAGNLYTVEANNGKRLILDPGVTWAKLQKALGYNLSNIEGALCTHEHLDHACAVKDVMRAGIDVYASEGTFEALGVIDGRRALAVMGYCGFHISDSFQAKCFRINHDAQDPQGYIVHEVNTGENLLFVPDSGFIKQRFNIKFSIIAIGCNYDINVLQHRVDTQDSNETLAKRLLTSHMEKQVTMRYLSEFCDLSRCREIHLLHMGNIDKEQAKKDFEKKLFVEVVII